MRKIYIFEMDIFSKINNTFTVTFDQFHAAMLHKNIYILFLTDPKLLNGSVNSVVWKLRTHRS